MDKEQIVSKELLEEIKTALQDVLVADIRMNGDTVELKFSNGQVFSLSVDEQA